MTTKRPLDVRFREKVDQRGPDECWPWLGSHWNNGYAQFHINQRPTKASRFAVQLDGREIGPGQVVMHSCDNPRCVNPGHLIVGTQSDNMLDMHRKGRGGYGRTPEIRAKMSVAIKAAFVAHPEAVWARRITHCKHGHPFAGDNLIIASDGHRRCRICVRHSSQRLEERRRAARQGA